MKQQNLHSLKVAIVYDWMDRWGGVERVLITLKEMMPEADFFTSVYDKKKASWANGYSIYSSFLQKFPKTIRKSRIASLIFYPFVFESFDFGDYDLVLSVSSSFAKSVITRPGTTHLCYLLTPSRYLWLYPHPAKKRFPGFLFRPYEEYMQRWDKVASSRPDYYISLSETTAKRCREIYGRGSKVIYPPFDVDYWSNLKPLFPSGLQTLKSTEDYYLLVSRLEPYKKAEIAIETFRKRTQDMLLIVGSGSMKDKLRKRAGDNTYFLEQVSDAELKWLYLHGKALIMPQEEDFGYVSLEAQLHGLPVIAYGKGGVTETVLKDKTGIFFPEQTVKSLSSTLERFGKISYNFSHNNPELGLLQAKKFAKSIFVRRMGEEITNSVLQNNKVRI